MSSLKNIHLLRLLRCFVVAVVLVLCTSSSFLGYAQQPEISIGETVKVVTDGQRLNLRKKPGLTGEIIGKLENGTTMRVIDGPRSADGYEWKLEGKTYKGWAASQFLQVIEPATSKASGSEASPVVTASDTVEGTENLLRKFHKIAPNAKVIGFNRVLVGEEPDFWSGKFWEYVISGMEAGAAAKEVTKEKRMGFYMISPSAVEVFGKQEVYLRSLEEGIVDIYGFTPCWWSGWAKPTWGNPLSVFTPDTLNTYREAIRVRDELKKAGYKGRIHENTSAKDAIETLSKAEVFFFYGHGLPDRIMFHDDQCIDSYISLEELPSELPNLKLVVLLACETAKTDEFDWREAIREWWENLWGDLERRVTDWWEEFQHDLERRVTDWWEEQKKRAIEEFLRQLCGAPAGLVIVSSYQFWRWRKRSKEPS